MVMHGCTAAFVTLLITLGCALTYTKFGNPSLVQQQRMNQFMQERNGQRRLASKGAKDLMKSFKATLMGEKQVQKRSLEDDEDDCLPAWFAASDPDVSKPGKGTALEWTKLKDEPNVYACLDKLKKFYVAMNAMHFLQTEATSEEVEKAAMVLDGTLGTVYLDPKVTKHTLIYNRGTLEGTNKDSVFGTVEYTTGDPHPEFPGHETCQAGLFECGVFEISEADKPCVGDNFEEEGCKIRVKQYLDNEFLEKDAREEETPPFCIVSARIAGMTSEDKLLEYLDGLQEAQCKAAQCGEAEGKIDYNSVYACTFKARKGTTFAVLLSALLFYFVLMGVVADGYLVPALVQIGRGLNMSDALLGATLLALGGAANDFMVGFVSALKKTQKEAVDGVDEGSDEDVMLWLGSVFGTGFFVNTLVAAMVMVFAPPEGISVIPAVFTRDVCFRIIAVGYMLCLGFYGKVNIPLAIIMVLLYCVYVAITLNESRNNNNVSLANNEGGDARGVSVTSGGSRGSRKSVALGQGIGGRASVLVSSSFAGQEGAISLIQGTRDEQHAESPPERLKRHLGWEEDGGIMDKVNFVVALPVRPFFIFTMATTTWDPLINIIMPITMCIFIPYGYPFGNLYEDFGSSTISVIAIIFFWVLGAGLTVAVKGASSQTPGRYISPQFFYWMTFLTALLWVGILANEVVGAMQTLGVIMGIPPMAMGITMLAWGNCVDNVFATIGLAKAGEFAVAITGIYAAPMFNVLFGNGLILVMLTCSEGWSTPFLMSACPKLLLSFLLVILACTILYAKMAGWRVNRTLGMILGVSYPVILALGFWYEGSPTTKPAA